MAAATSCSLDKTLVTTFWRVKIPETVAPLLDATLEKIGDLLESVVVDKGGTGGVGIDDFGLETEQSGIRVGVQVTLNRSY